MAEQDWLAERFEQHRPRLRAVSYRMLGSLSEADDAVQEAWLRVSRADTSQVEDLGALAHDRRRAGLPQRPALARRSTARSRSAPTCPTRSSSRVDGVDPEREALIADSVGLALLIVLDTLAPAERLALVLHDMFDVPFDQIAAIIDRSEPATRQLASRARRRLRATPAPDATIAEQWELVDAFLAAARDGDFDALLRVLDPDVVLRADAGVTVPDGSRIERGARAVASGAVAFRTLGYVSRLALVNGAPGVVTFAGERPFSVVGFTVAGGRIVEMNILVDPARLERLDLTVLAR